MLALSPLTWVEGEVTEITLGGTPLITQIEWTPFAGTVKRWGWAMAVLSKIHSCGASDEIAAWSCTVVGGGGCGHCRPCWASLCVGGDG
jgi:hypothetical protein